jgi:hypothetical protein|nr:MAG TPA: hypothetical protein [Crassvirales sp.]
MIVVNRFPKQLKLYLLGDKTTEKSVTIYSNKQYYLLVKLLNNHGSSIQIYDPIPTFINSSTIENYNELCLFFNSSTE